jgi:hypothetical protein
MRSGFGHLSGALDGLKFRTSFVIVDSMGQYFINPEPYEALSAALIGGAEPRAAASESR